MKIIAIDNYARENVSDKLICKDISQYYRDPIVDFLNSTSKEWFYKLVEDDYKLYDASVLY